MKKYVAMMMTLAMVLALAVPALAAPTNINSSANSAGVSSGEGYIASYGGATNVPVLNVTVKFSGDNSGLLVLNPYQLEAGTKGNVSSSAVPANTTISKKAQVIASPVEIENQSDCAVEAIVVKAKATVSSTDLKLVQKPIDSTKASKDLSAYLVIYGADKVDAETPATYDKTTQVALSTSDSSAVRVLPNIAASTGKGYILIGGNLSTNMALDAEKMWGSGITVSGVSYNLKIRPVVATTTTTTT